VGTFRPNTLVSVFLDEADEDTTDGYGYDVPNADPPGTDADARIGRRTARTAGRRRRRTATVPARSFT
jgi:hypothetical protein